jgi:hypothetical protein
MGTFTFDTSKGILKLNSVTKEDFIILTKIELSSEGNIFADVFFWEQIFRDGSTRKIPIVIGGNEIVDNKTALLEFDIENCQNSVLVSNGATNKIYTLTFETLIERFEREEKQKSVQANTNALEKRKWISEVDNLFKEISQDWLIDFKDLVKTETGTLQITEQYIGTYEISCLKIKTNNEKQIEFNPIATYIIGGYGRIDLIFKGLNFKSAMLVLNKIDDKFYWTITERSGRNVYEKPVKSDFNKGKLIKLIKDVITG